MIGWVFVVVFFLLVVLAAVEVWRENVSRRQWDEWLPESDPRRQWRRP